MALLSVAMVDVWKGVGLATVIYIAGIVSIPREYFEAARVDGAGDGAVLREAVVDAGLPADVVLAALKEHARTPFREDVWKSLSEGFRFVPGTFDDPAAFDLHAETVIDASPEQVWAVVSDLRRMGEWSPQCRRCEWEDERRGVGQFDPQQTAALCAMPTGKSGFRFKAHGVRHQPRSIRQPGPEGIEQRVGQAATDEHSMRMGAFRQAFGHPGIDHIQPVYTQSLGVCAGAAGP